MNEYDMKLIIVLIISLVFFCEKHVLAKENDLDVTKSCILKNDPNFSGCNFVLPKLGIVDWNVTQCTWIKKSDKSLCAAFQTDAILFYNTLFPDENRVRELSLSPEFLADQKKREKFLKRLFLYLVLAPLEFTSHENDVHDLKLWSYPLATALSHGGRILFEVDDVPPQDSIYRKFLTGSWTQPVTGDIRRAAASHGVKRDKFKNIFEQSLKLLGSFKNIYIGLKGAHRGYNIAFGGLGNEDGSGRIIGPQGSRYDKLGRFMPKVQHGHVYMQPAKFGQKQVLLLGIEQSAPGKENADGHTHSALSAFQDSSRLPGLTGDVKMVKLLPPEKGGPAVYGGMRVVMSKSLVDEVEILLEKIDRLPREQQEEFFKEILTSPVTKSYDLLKKIVKNTNSEK